MSQVSSPRRGLTASGFGAVPYLAVLVPPALVLACIVRFGVNVPFMDDWELQPLLAAWQTAHSPLPLAWGSYNDHRVFFPQLVLLAVALPTHWDTRAQMYVNFALALLIFALLWLVLRLDRLDSRTRPWAAIALSLMVFTPAAWEAWTWAWMIQRYLGVAAVVAGLLLLSRWPGRWRSLLLAALLTVVASLSTVEGLAFWPAGAVAILMLWGRRRILWALAWLAMAAVAAIVYAAGYHHQADVGNFMSDVVHGRSIGNDVTFWTVYVGSWLGEGVANLYNWAGYGLSVATGVVAAGLFGRMAIACFAVLVVAAVRTWPQHAQDWGPGIVLMVYVFISATLAMIGRSTPVSLGLQSRYVLVSILAWVALIVPAADLHSYLRSVSGTWRAGARAGIALVAVFLLLNTWAMWLEARGQLQAHAAELRAAQVVLDSPAIEPDSPLAPLYPSLPVLRERVLQLRSWQGWSLRSQ